MLEMIPEPPYGWWTTPDLQKIRAESAGITPDTVTELDVLDDERVAVTAWVYCEECDDVAPAYDMVLMDDGAWFCPTCFWHRKNEGNYFGRMMR